MRFVIQARLDDRSRKRLAVLVRELGWSPSRVVREGLRVLEASHLRRKKPGIIGLGKFKSGVPDMGASIIPEMFLVRSQFWHTECQLTYTYDAWLLEPQQTRVVST